MIGTLVSLFTVERGTLKIYLVRKRKDPYKGYWVLPGKSLEADELLEACNDKVIENTIGIPNISFEQCHTFSSINEQIKEKAILTLFVGLIDTTTIELKTNNQNGIEGNWFPLNNIPKLGYNHEEIIKKAVDFLTKKISNSNALKVLFPSDFTLPEIQKVYEQLLNKTIDRRNFRKKFVKLGLVEDTGYKNEGFNGRPAKLYKFKENLKERELF